MGRKRKIFLDTNTIIYFLEGVKEFEVIGSFETYYYSFITEIELLAFGNNKQRTVILNFLKRGKRTDIDDKIVSETIKVRKGTGLKIPDAIIVASAKRVGADLYTSDNDILKKITGLNTINLREQ